MSPDEGKKQENGSGSSLSLESLAPVLFGPARSLEELKQAYGLVHTSYLSRGYIEASQSGLRFGFHNLLPETVTLVAVLRGMVIATVSLVVDSPWGLPMDEIYGEELSPLRKRGERLGEVTMLADRRREFRRTLPMVLALFRLLTDYARKVAGLDQLCITLNPRHSEFYGRLLHFEPLGPEKQYPSVQDNPALAMRFELGALAKLVQEDARYGGMYRRTEGIQRVSFGERHILTGPEGRELAKLLMEEGRLSSRQQDHVRVLYGGKTPA